MRRNRWLKNIVQPTHVPIWLEKVNASALSISRRRLRRRSRIRSMCLPGGRGFQSGIGRRSRFVRYAGHRVGWLTISRKLKMAGRCWMRPIYKRSVANVMPQRRLTSRKGGKSQKYMTIRNHPVHFGFNRVVSHAHTAEQKFIFHEILKDVTE